MQGESYLSKKKEYTQAQSRHSPLKLLRNSRSGRSAFQVAKSIGNP